MPGTPKEHLEYTINEWNSGEFRKITDSLPENLSTIYDVGANAGGFTEVLHRKYPSASFFCFEPVRNTYDFLKDAVPFAKCFDLGIYYGKKESNAVWRGENMGAIFLEEMDSGEPRVFTGEKLKLTTFEELEISKPDLIKLDVEGAEINIIENSEIVKKCPYLIVEWHYDGRYSFEEFIKQHLPNHKILQNISRNQYILKYEI